MADNVAITPGSGATVAADEISSVLYQRIKLIHGADGVNAGDVAEGNPFPVKSMIQRVSVQIAGLSNSTYAAGDQMGTLLTFANMARASGGGGEILGATISDSDNVCGPLELLLFDSSVTLTGGDNGAFSISDSDLLKVVQSIQLAGPIPYTLGRMVQAQGILVPYVCSAGTSLYGGVIARSNNTAQPTSTAFTVNLYFRN